ncbi:Helix-turn-helix domain-containing protein [Seinonella peptonophila]|uniref:Helix-turn-helix domain-containing protein n=1 Tax=Seinonella peptonophila TaxID=112248 RepID=A0A1M4VEZ0_9BACL|nr:helix-turn-helix domain-containing protein [Seinonella peptonophila]SHE67574.1 Helix-turn-helix domain-containing protein [Seinonella peptonophila]
MSNLNSEYVTLSKKYSQFKDIDSLNSSIRQHLYNKKHNLTKSAITIYKVLARFAAKYVGCAFLKINSIAEIAELSRSTVIRSLKLLEALGMVTKHHMMRIKSGGHGANLYVFQPFKKVSEEVKDTPNMELREKAEIKEKTSPEAQNSEPETEIYQSNEININKKRIWSPYERFKSICFSFVEDKKLLYQLYGVYLGQIKYLKDAYLESELVETGLYALRTAFMKTKKMNIKNLPGYFHGVFSKCLDQLYEEAMTGEGGW